MFLTYKISDHLILISELDDGRLFFTMQLVIGNKKAALIDAGLGKDKGLYDLVKTFTDLPVALYITHGHGDHIGNADLFKEIHMSKLDQAMFYHDKDFFDLQDGEQIDLGGVVLEAYAVPGHTDGCFCFLNRAEKYALTGDSINVDTWLCWDTCASPGEYALTVRRFEEKRKAYGITAIYDGHSIEPLPENICDEMADALTEIAEGKIQKDRAHHYENGKIKHQHILGNAKIIYDKELLCLSRK